MFDIGWTEMLVVAVVAILVVGPKDLPGMLRTIGKTVGNLRRMAGDFQRQFSDALKESELDELKSDLKGVGSIANPLDDINKSANELMDSIGLDDDDIDEAIAADVQAKSGDDKPTETVTKSSDATKKKVGAKPTAKPAAKTSVAKRKPTAKKAPVKKAPVKKAPLKKTPVKKVAAKRAAAAKPRAAKSAAKTKTTQKSKTA